MILGILAGLATCALWGLSFVAPRAVAPIPALDLTVARYGIFGLASLALMILPAFRPTGLSARHWLWGLILGGAGYIGYFLAVAQAVRLAGPALPPLVIGLMPVVLALIANARDRTVPWRALALPLSLIAAGIGAVHAEALAGGGPAGLWPGLLAAGAALAIWVAYAMGNAAILTAPDAPASLPWTVLQGLGAGLGSLLLWPLTSDALPEGASPRTFLLWALILGLAGSWLATWFWVVASRRLPLALAAQLIVAETVFGLGFGFAFDRRWPTGAESAGALLQVLGVALAIRVFHRRA